MQGSAKASAKSLCYVIPGYSRGEGMQGSCFLAIESQGPLTCGLRRIAQHREELGGTIIKRQRPLLEQRIIFPDLSTPHQFETTTGQVSLRRRSKAGRGRGIVVVDILPSA